MSKSMKNQLGWLIFLYKLLDFIEQLKLNKQDKQIAERLLTEIISRLDFLCEVGLSYLTLNRKSNSLSGGESQRINLATSLAAVWLGRCISSTNQALVYTPKIQND